MPAFRFVLLLYLGLFAFPVLRPTVAKACGMQTKECCQAAAHQNAQADRAIPEHCPFKPAQADQCCSACPLTASLIDSLTTPFIFAEGSGTILRLRDFSPVTRSTRPPYPPPRSS